MLSPSSLVVGTHVAFGTHDDRIAEELITLAQYNAWPPDRFEFEMLLGVRHEMQADLIRRGFTVRFYVPFGENLFPYAIRRVAQLLHFALRAISPKKQSREAASDLEPVQPA